MEECILEEYKYREKIEKDTTGNQQGGGIASAGKPNKSDVTSEKIVEGESDK